jgi:hypothetical protein
VAAFGLSKSNTMVIVRLQGGLGNQLFQYAAGLAVAQGQADQVAVDTSYYWYVRNRRYVLDLLGFRPKRISFFTHPLEAVLSWPLIGEIWQKMYLLFGRYQVVREQEVGSLMPITKNPPQNTYLSGFWQQLSYVELQKKSLFQHLSFPKFNSEVEKKLAQKISSTRSVAVHVRRGDYVNHSTFRVASPEYYQQAFEYISKRVKQPHFFIFSDDIVWCKAHFGEPANMTFVEGVDDEVSELHLMSTCQHHVMANSTFSWWGAVLAPQSKIVIAPKEWNGTLEAAQKLLHPEWKKF